MKGRKTSAPPEGYVCKLCDVTGHWIQQCPSNRGRKRKKKSGGAGSGGHSPVPGVDPSEADISAAKEMQKIPPPRCRCGKRSRLKKVKKSRVDESSRANGVYFFFCAKPREESCGFARPAESEGWKRRKAGEGGARKKAEEQVGNDGSHVNTCTKKSPGKEETTQYSLQKERGEALKEDCEEAVKEEGRKKRKDDVNDCESDDDVSKSSSDNESNDSSVSKEGRMTKKPNQDGTKKPNQDGRSSSENETSSDDSDSLSGSDSDSDDDQVF